MPNARKKSDRVRRMKGEYNARGRKFGIVVSQFNEFLTSRLLEGALDTLVRHGVREKDIHVAYVPGAFEVPFAASQLMKKVAPDALITLSVVIRGETKHFDQVVNQCAEGLRLLAEKSDVPVILGMIPADTVQQAMNRAGIKQMNKGREWALAALEMADLSKKLRNGKKK